MTADGTDEAQTTAKRRRFTWRHALGVGVAIAVVVATFAFILPKIADYRDVWGAVKGLSWKDIALLAGATILNLVTFAPPWMAALPGLRFRQAFVVTQASTASTYVAPGGVAVGMALSFAMLRAWGFVSAAVGLAVALTGVWNQLSMLAFPTLALVLLTFTGRRPHGSRHGRLPRSGDLPRRGGGVRRRAQHTEARHDASATSRRGSCRGPSV